MTMRHILSSIMALGFMLAGHVMAHAAEPIPADPPALQKRLASYDPAAVEAARHYYAAPARRAGLLKVFDSVQRHLLGDIAKQNPGLDKDVVAKTMSIATGSIGDRLDILTQMSMVAALDTLTTSELVALDKFYSSPEGLSIVAKMPQIGDKMPEIMKAVMPAYVDEVKTKLKAADPELKL